MAPRMPDMATVLVIEDDIATRNLLTTALSHLGVDVAAAADGAEALAILNNATTPCRLILLDLIMPGMNGREFLDQLSLRPASRPAVILVTAAIGFEDLPDGVDLVVKKPFEILALTSTVVNFLQFPPAVAPLDLLRPEPESPVGGE